MILSVLRKLVLEKTEAVLKSEGKAVPLPQFDLSIPPGKIPGELAANMALAVAKAAGLPPRSLAEKILKDFPQDGVIARTEIAGPGFLNFWLTDEAYGTELAALLEGKKDLTLLGKTPPKYLIEFVSANPTGPLHIGHGRGAALGDSLVRIFRYLGYDVAAEFYINDSGGQIRKLGYSVEARVKELKGEPVQFPEDGYHGAYVFDIAKQALESKRSFTPVHDKQIMFDENDLAGFASAINLKIQQKDLADFGVHYDRWFPESTLHKEKAIPKLFELLKSKNLVYENEGALWFRATDFGDEKDRVLQKGNEAPTYFAADITYHLNKFDRGYDKLVNIWGADHHGYALRVKGALQALGKDASKLEIILNQLVSIKGGRLSKRAGDMITLRDVVDEVGKDATRFFFALRSPGAHFEFDLDLAKKQASDNPVYYVQYVHARCCSILQEAEKRGVLTPQFKWKDLSVKPKLEETEKNVLLRLSSFDSVVEQCARDYSNHHLTVYLLELAGAYHTFYEKCHVLVDEEPVRSFRLDLIRALKMRVAQGLNLLGVDAPQKL